MIQKCITSSMFLAKAGFNRNQIMSYITCEYNTVWFSNTGLLNRLFTWINIRKKFIQIFNEV